MDCFYSPIPTHRIGHESCLDGHTVLEQNNIATAYEMPQTYV